MSTLKASVAQRNIVALAVFAFFRGTGVSIFMTLFPLYMVDLGYQVADVGTIATLSSIPCIALLPLIGILIDWIGRKPIATLTGLTTFLALFMLQIHFPSLKNGKDFVELNSKLRGFLAPSDGKALVLIDSIRAKIDKKLKRKRVEDLSIELFNNLKKMSKKIG